MEADYLLAALQGVAVPDVGDRGGKIGMDGGGHQQQKQDQAIHAHLHLLPVAHNLGLTPIKSIFHDRELAPVAYTLRYKFSYNYICRSNFMSQRNDLDLDFEGDSREVLQEWPDDASSRAGHNLRRVQKGRDPHDWKPFSQVGPGTKEIRIHLENEYRVFYVTKFGSTVYVLHAFIKKDEQTPQHEIDKAKERYKDLEKRYRSKGTSSGK